MKKTYYVLTNKSRSEGTYYLDGEYISIFPGDTVKLEKQPANVTSNVIVSMYQRDVGETILNLKPRTTKVVKKSR